MENNIMDVARMFALANEIQQKLPSNWSCIVDHRGFHVVLWSRHEQMVTQRRIFISPEGVCKIAVHCRWLTEERLKELGLYDISVSFPSMDNVDVFSNSVLTVVNKVRALEICAGADHKKKYEAVWKLYCDQDAILDENPYFESRYTRTVRSSGCVVLVGVSTFRCKPCAKLGDLMSKRQVPKDSPEYNPSTRNTLLSEKQKLAKLKNLQRKVCSLSRAVTRQKERIEGLLHQDGVKVDSELSSDLCSVLENAHNLSPVQKLFLEQQLKRQSVKSPSGMRWHPTMIRLALSIRLKSSAAYRAIRDSNMISLPSERTLFDYTHVFPNCEGLRPNIITKITEQVETSPTYQAYHVLLFDEMSISRKLVYEKHTGEIVGYVNLDEVDQELVALQSLIDGDKEYDDTPDMASKMLTYMLKGVASNVKEVIASYAVHDISKETLFEKTWEIIRCLERCGIRIIALTCDGHPVNRAFFKLHTPVTTTLSDVVFDTVNMAAPDRVLYFMSDIAHLIKTLRNCLACSGRGGKYTRLMQRNNMPILYSFAMQKKTLVRSYKLNSQNVFLNSYSVMNVKYAAQVLSNTVATDIENHDWPNSAETVTYIRKCNNFFDCLNGAHSLHGKRTNNPRLNPYKSIDDDRYNEILDFVEYLTTWRNEILSDKNLPGKDKTKRFISQQTYEGVEITARAFIGATKFLLGAGVQFINARVFSQDPLEQYFGKVRNSVGGSSNPNAKQCQEIQTKLSLLRETGTGKQRRGNTESAVSSITITNEPLPKRKRSSDPLQNQSS